MDRGENEGGGSPRDAAIRKQSTPTQLSKPPTRSALRRSSRAISTPALRRLVRKTLVVVRSRLVLALALRAPRGRTRRGPVRRDGSLPPRAPRGVSSRAVRSRGRVAGASPRALVADVASPGRSDAVGAFVRGARERHGRERVRRRPRGGRNARAGRPHDALPRLAPVQTAFTVSMSVFLLDDPDVRHGYRALFWKGLAADDRTPSAWLVPGSNRITFRVSTTRAKEVWGTSAGAIPARRWAHVAFSLDADDRAMRLYVDGRLDAAAEIPGHAVANPARTSEGTPSAKAPARSSPTCVHPRARRRRRRADGRVRFATRSRCARRRRRDAAPPRDRKLREGRKTPPFARR